MSPAQAHRTGPDRRPVCGNLRITELEGRRWAIHIRTDPLETIPGVPAVCGVRLKGGILLARN